MQREGWLVHAPPSSPLKYTDPDKHDPKGPAGASRPRKGMWMISASSFEVLPCPTIGLCQKGPQIRLLCGGKYRQSVGPHFTFSNMDWNRSYFWGQHLRSTGPTSLPLGMPRRSRIPPPPIMWPVPGGVTGNSAPKCLLVEKHTRWT